MKFETESKLLTTFSFSSLTDIVLLLLIFFLLLLVMFTAVGWIFNLITF